VPENASQVARKFKPDSGEELVAAPGYLRAWQATPNIVALTALTTPDDVDRTSGAFTPDEVLQHGADA
jgi:hypothetical protein